MLSGFFVGKCVTPLYWQKDVATAQRCGLWNGVLYSLLATMVAAAALIAHEWKLTTTPRLHNADYPKMTFPIHVLAMCVVVSVWMILPLLFRHSAVSQWHGYQDEIVELQKEYEMSKLDAINTVASFASGQLGEAASGLLSGAGGVLLGKGQLPAGPGH